ncbi:LNS2 domain-containing protein [Spongorhabdus nitratireducens]
MRAAICLGIMVYAGMLVGGEFDHMPQPLSMFGCHGQWIHDLSKSDAVGYFQKSLNGVSDTIVWLSQVEGPLQLNSSPLYGNQTYVFGCYQEILIKKARASFSGDLRILFSGNYGHDTRHFDSCNANGVYPISIGGFLTGINVIALPITDDVYSYSYVYVLPDPPSGSPDIKPLKFAVLDIDDTAVFTAKCDINNMILNCQQAPANGFMKHVARCLYDEGYTIVYLSRRDYMLYSLTRWQLRKNGFPEGLIFLDLNNVLDTSSGSRPQTPSLHKVTTLAWLSNYGELSVGFGDKESDNEQYKQAKVKVIFQLQHKYSYFVDKTADVTEFVLKQQGHQPPGLKRTINLKQPEETWGWDEIKSVIQAESEMSI